MFDDTIDALIVDERNIDIEAAMQKFCNDEILVSLTE